MLSLKAIVGVSSWQLTGRRVDVITFKFELIIVYIIVHVLILVCLSLVTVNVIV